MRGRRAPPRWLSRPPRGLRSLLRRPSPPPRWPKHPQRGSDTPQGGSVPLKNGPGTAKGAQTPLRWLTHPTGGLRSPIRQLSPPPRWPRHPQIGSDTPSGGSDTPKGGSVPLQSGPDTPSCGSDTPPRGLSLPFAWLRSPPQVAPHLLSSPYFFPLERMRGKSPQQWAPNVEAAPQGAAQVHFVAPHFLQRSPLAFPTWCGPGAPQRSRAAMLQAALHLVRPPGITPNHYTTTRGFNSNTTVIP